MKIGIVGAGHIGKTLARKLGAAGHDVKVANSRGPETIESEVLDSGARAVTAEEAMTDVDAVILSIPFLRIPDIAPLVAKVRAEATIIDTSNYYPLRDGKIAAIDAGQVESLWVAEKLGRPIAKAWNSVLAGSLITEGKPPGTPGRFALSVAADREVDRKVGMALVEDTGFDGFDAGTLAESWRQQPGAPCYCTDLTREEMPAALAAAEKARLPKRRDPAMAIIMERFDDGTTTPDGKYLLRLNRALYR